jgi:hypothetical protein
VVKPIETKDYCDKNLHIIKNECIFVGISFISASIMPTTKKKPPVLPNASVNKQETIVSIANPVYDTVFKYLMEDNAVAKLMVSSIIGEKVVQLEPKPQEKTTSKEPTGTSTITVMRMDFAAKIKTATGHKIVIIEMQKASLPTDIMRFRRYLGEQYSDESNRTPPSEGGEAMQLYTIYFLGEGLGIRGIPVLCISPEIRDVATNTIISEKNEFIDSLNHKSWVVQIDCLKERRRNELEQLLSVFDQSNRTSDIHIMNVCEEDFPEKFRPVIRRLKAAASSEEVKKQMKEEDEFLKYMQNWFRAEAKKLEKIISEKDEMLADKDKTIDERDKALNEKDKSLNEKDKALDENRRALEAALAHIVELERNRK